MTPIQEIKKIKGILAYVKGMPADVRIGTNSIPDKVEWLARRLKQKVKELEQVTGLLSTYEERLNNLQMVLRGHNDR